MKIIHHHDFFRRCVNDFKGQLKSHLEKCLHKGFDKSEIEIITIGAVTGYMNTQFPLEFEEFTNTINQGVSLSRSDKKMIVFSYGELNPENIAHYTMSELFQLVSVYFMSDYKNYPVEEMH